MRITKTQSEILRHRLEVPECIAECLSEIHDPETVESRASEICDFVEDNTSLPPIESEIDRDILADAIEGCTYYGSIEYSLPPLQVANHRRAGEALAKKIEKHIGRPTFIELG
jgi:hypothetical protein